ncbi:aldo/keto reductase [Actinocrispum wychmicini]|nr:aldo/keto reductase [Actinocrispum wychmicini]
MPQVGLAAVSTTTVAEALAAGYRGFEVADPDVGQALVRSGVPRHELFVTTRMAESPRAFEESLARLRMDYVDLCLLAAPVDDFVQAWKGLEKVAADGRARAIGVCDCLIPHLRRLSEETSTVPAVNRVELNPGHVQPILRAYHSEHGITTQAYRPLGDLVGNDEIGFMAQKYGKTPAQIILRWHVELKHVISVEPTAPREYIDIFDFELAEDDVLALSEMA